MPTPAPPALAQPAGHDRFVAVLAHIDAQLDSGDLSLQRLAQMASLSKYHFQRQFTARFGFGVHEVVQHSRLRRAAHQLAFRQDRQVIEIALDAGYHSAQAFSHAFKRWVGQSPSAFRRHPDWPAWQQLTTRLTCLRSRHMHPTHALDDVRIVDRPAVRVALLEHRGDPRRLGDTLQTFIAWRRAQRLPPSVSATYNIVHSDPETTDPEHFRFGLCAATDRPITPNAHGVVAHTLAGGRHAVLRHTGSSATIAATVRFLDQHWLPASGEVRRDAPLLFERLRFFPDVPEHLAETDVWLPLA